VRLILVSASPRRRELLAGLNYPFEVHPSHAHELWLANSPAELAALNALRKVKASKHFGSPNCLLLGADTIISSGGRVLGKPAGKDSASRMLAELSGKSHQVITGFCLVGFDSKGEALGEHSEAVTSSVQFRELRDSDIREYLATGEWEGKAGAYAIQGEARKFIAAFDGDYENIVGLPINCIRERIRTHFPGCGIL